MRDLDDIGAELSLLRVMRRVISECGGVHRGRGPAVGLAQRKHAPGGEQNSPEVVSESGSKVGDGAAD